jgi:hypothetical protein
MYEHIVPHTNLIGVFDDMPVTRYAYDDTGKNRSKLLTIVVINDHENMIVVREWSDKFQNTMNTYFSASRTKILHTSVGTFVQVPVEDVRSIVCFMEEVNSNYTIPMVVHFKDFDFKAKHPLVKASKKQKNAKSQIETPVSCQIEQKRHGDPETTTSDSQHVYDELPYRRKRFRDDYSPPREVDNSYRDRKRSRYHSPLGRPSSPNLYRRNM